MECSLPQKKVLMYGPILLLNTQKIFNEINWLYSELIILHSDRNKT